MDKTSGEYIVSRDELLEEFFELVDGNSSWIDECSEIDSSARDMAVILLSEIAGVAKFIQNLDDRFGWAKHEADAIEGQNIYSAKDASGNLITNPCYLNRSEIPNS